MIAIELFGCSGGMAEGFRRAGIAFTHAFDWDADACASYAANLGHKPVQMDVRDLVSMAAAGWSPGPVQLLVADPPCTPWSKAGKRKGLADERDMLRETCELIRHLRPANFLIGNVPGLDEGPGLKALRQTIGALARFGYCIDFARLDAANFGVPQHRLRPFWFGHQEEGNCITWPAATHGPPADARQLCVVAPLKPWVACREALGHLPLEELGRPVKLRWRGDDVSRGGHRPSSADAPARTMTRNANGDGSLLTHARHPVNQLEYPSYTLTSKGDGRGAQGACDRRQHRQPGRKARASLAADPAGVVTTGENGDGNVLAWPWDRPATTVTARPGLAPPGHHDESFAVMSLPDAIVLSEKAAAILQGFPEGWRFEGKTKRSRWGQLGMAMPPPLAEAVARSLAKVLRG